MLRRVNDASYITINSIEMTSQDLDQMRVEVSLFSLPLSPQNKKEPDM
jgi:hypothetical protein